MKRLTTKPVLLATENCGQAILHVKGLTILTIVKKTTSCLKNCQNGSLPKWSRIVVDELDSSGSYPVFTCFTEFLSKEARIACNPIASPLMINFKPVDDRIPKIAKTFNTKTQTKCFTQEGKETNSSKPKWLCFVCKNKAHGITRYPAFADKSVEDKKAFVHENRLCVGCFRKGHRTKDCKRCRDQNLML